MKKIVFFFLTCIAMISAKAQTTFPEDWTGKWAGTLKIYKAQEVSMELPMQLHILPTDTAGQYNYTIIYGEGEKADKRPYTLKTIDAEKGQYVIDENNSIVLEADYQGGVLYSRFAGMGALLLSRIEMRGEQLCYEIISGSSTPASTTGDEVIKGDTIPPIDGYRVDTRHIAFLERL